MGNLKASTEAAAYKVIRDLCQGCYDSLVVQELKSGNTELCVALEQDEFTKNRIHGIADELERELAKAGALVTHERKGASYVGALICTLRHICTSLAIRLHHPSQPCMNHLGELCTLGGDGT